MQDQILRTDTGGCVAVHMDRHGFRLALQQALRGHHVADLGGTDAKRQRTERAVGGGVAVAADDRHARLGGTQLGADHVHDAAVFTIPAMQLDAELAAVGFQLGDLRLRFGVCIRTAAIGIRRQGRGGMIQRGQYAIGPAQRQAALAQLAECLRRGDFVHQMQIDVEDRRRVGGFGYNDMRVPHFFEQGFCGHAEISICGCARP